MYDGMAFIIHDKELYEANKQKVIEVIKNQNDEFDLVCDASVIEYKNNLFLIIDGHESLLAWKNPLEEASDFLHEFLLLTKASYSEKTKYYYSSYKALYQLENYQKLEILIKEHPKALSEDERKHMTSKMEEIREDFDKIKEMTSRDNVCGGVFYSDASSYALPMMFDIPRDEALIEQLSSDIFKATTEKIDVNDVKFIETLYQLKINN